MARLPRYHLPRPRLTDRLAAASVAEIIGAGGYGKSLLASELSDALGVPTITTVLESTGVSGAQLPVRLRSAATRSGLSDVSARMDEAARGEPAAAMDGLLEGLRGQAALIVVDEIQYADPAAVDLLLRLAEQLAPEQRLIVVGRHAPPGIERLRHRDPDAWLGTADLALTTGEVADLCGRGFGLVLDAVQAAALRSATGGWAAAVVLAAARARSGRGTGSVGATGDPGLLAIDAGRPGGPAVLARLVADILNALSRPEQAALVQAAHLPLLDEAVVRSATGIDGLLTTAEIAGLPLLREADGWYRLIGPVQDLLVARAPARAGVLVRAAREYAARGHVAMAADLLLAGHQNDDAADLLGGLSVDQAEAMDVVELSRLADVLGERSLARSPRVLLHLARSCESAAAIHRRAAALDRGRRLTEHGPDQALARELLAEQARDLVRDEEPAAAEALALRLLGETGAGEDLTRARLLDALGWAATARKDEVSLERAEERLAMAAGMYRSLGRWSWLAQLMLPVAILVHLPRGRGEDALRCLDEALALIPHQRRQRGVILTFRAEVLISLGRYTDAEAGLLEAANLAELTGDVRLRAYVAWERARSASQQGDVSGVVAALHTAEAARGDWFEHSGCLFLADAADFLDRVGRSREAVRSLARAREQPVHDEVALVRVEATILARSGDPEAAEAALQRWLTSDGREPKDLWLIALLRSRAAMRRGDPGAAALAEEAFELAARLGHPELPLVRERAVAEQLLGLAGPHLEALGHAVGRLPTLVSLLGRFEVTRGGRPVEVPAGQARQLVKVVAVAGGHVTAEQAVAELWPDVASEVGANRLRTVLNRLREAAGDLVTREVGTLRLAAGVRTDTVAFEEAARRALALAAAQSPEAVPMARGALAGYGGDLLPEDPYASWTLAPRERLRRRALALLDLCADAAAAGGDLDEAVRSLTRAVEIAPEEEERYLAAARHLLTQGRRGAARSMVDRAWSVLDELGLTPPAELLELDRSVRRA